MANRKSSNRKNSRNEMDRIDRRMNRQKIREAKSGDSNKRRSKYKNQFYDLDSAISEEAYFGDLL